ncbi:MAG: DJ-1/PfpI family protein [Oscillospiraceae bacterium]
MRKGNPSCRNVICCLPKGSRSARVSSRSIFSARAGLETYTVSVQNATPSSARTACSSRATDAAGVAGSAAGACRAPGGMPGTTNLAKSPAVEALVRRTLEHGGRAAAICAAPSVLAQYGLLAGRRATCYPGFESKCTGAHMVDADVVTDGPIDDRPRPRRGRSRSHSSSCVCSPTSRPPRARPRRSSGDMTVDNAARTCVK